MLPSQIASPDLYGLARCCFRRSMESFNVGFLSLQEHEQAKAIANLELFGRPVADGLVSVQCINRVILSKVAYDFTFGPTGV